MIKGIEENKLSIIIKRLLQQLKLFWKYKCTDENSDMNKKKLHPPLPFTVTVLLIAVKLLSLWLWNFQSASLSIWTALWKSVCNYMTGLCLVAYLSDEGKKHFF